MRNRIRIKPEFPYLFSRIPIVGEIDCVGEQEFGFPFRRVSFDGNDDGGTDKNTVLLLFGNHNAALFNAEAFAQLGGNNNRPSFAHFCRFHGAPHIQIMRIA